MFFKSIRVFKKMNDVKQEAKEHKPKSWKQCAMYFKKVKGYPIRDRAYDIIIMYDAIDEPEEVFDKKVDLLVDLLYCYPKVVDRVMEERPDIKDVFTGICHSIRELEEEKKREEERAREEEKREEGKRQ
jgi:hypothetical protein